MIKIPYIETDDIQIKKRKVSPLLSYIILSLFSFTIPVLTIFFTKLT